MFEIVSLQYEETLKAFFLTIKTPDRKNFYERELVCHLCSRKIDDEVPYYCSNGKFFMHKECLIRGNHENLYLSEKNPTHLDNPVSILFVDADANSPTNPAS